MMSRYRKEYNLQTFLSRIMFFISPSRNLDHELFDLNHRLQQYRLHIQHYRSNFDICVVIWLYNDYIAPLDKQIMRGVIKPHY